MTKDRQGTKIQKESGPVCARMDGKVHVSTRATDPELWQDRETILALQKCAINSLGQEEYFLDSWPLLTPSTEALL